MTISNLDYLSVNQLYVFDRQTGEEIVSDVLAPGIRGPRLSDRTAPTAAEVKTKKLAMAFEDTGTGTRLTARTNRIQLDLEAATRGDCLAVVVPWDDKRFQYTVKDLARPVTGSITIDGRTYEIPPATTFAALDRGRGRWPYSLTWNWATACGISDGHTIGLQLGGKWTDGTGSTENGITVDGDLTYWPHLVHWEYDTGDWYEPWRVTGEFVDATLTPFHVRMAKTNVAVIASSAQQAFGTWSGTVVDGSGRQHSLDGLVGWAEQVKNRW